jgi:hypothetical protein
MTPALVHNLTKVFSEPTVDERDVVYALVETRKLLETEGMKGRFPELTFFCDWVVHPKLSGTFTQQVVRYFDEYQELFTPPRPNPAHNISALMGITSLEQFRTQLMRLFWKFQIPIKNLQNPWWEQFCEQYAVVIQDCPSVIKAKSPTKHVAKVLLEAMPEDSGLRKIVGGVVLKWGWEDINGKKLGEITSFMNVSQDLNTARHPAPPQQNAPQTPNLPAGSPHQ